MASVDNKIVEIFIPGPAGRLEAKYFKSKKNTSPMALVLHPHPQYGGTMNNKIVCYTFRKGTSANADTSLIHSHVLRGNHRKR